MEKLAIEYRDKGFDFVFVYTREAHPGELRPHHTRFEQKLDQARAFQSQNAYSGPNWPLIPGESGHRFRSKSSTDSAGKASTFGRSLERVDRLPE